MKLKYFFIGVLLLRCLFIAMPDIIIEPFLHPSDEMKQISAFQYTFRLVDQLAFFMVTVIMWLMVMGKIKATPGIKITVTAYMFVCGLDLLDYLVFANSEWFPVRTYPVTTNVLMLPLYWLLTSVFFSGD